jgi:hypothetical protein
MNILKGKGEIETQRQTDRWKTAKQRKGQTDFDRHKERQIDRHEKRDRQTDVDKERQTYECGKTERNVDRERQTA